MLMRTVGLIATAFGLALIGRPAEAALPEWEHVSAFNLAETSGAMLNDYPVELSIDTQALIAAGQLQADLSDLRFAYDCAGDSLIQHWVQPGTEGTADTRVWVSVNLAASQTTLVRMFHGNPLATSNEATVDALFDGPVSATDQISGGSDGGVANSTRGFSFTPQRDILVVDMGKNEPNGTTRTLTLWDDANQTALRTISVGGAANLYSYEPLIEPIWLDAGTDYIATIFQGANDGYSFVSSSQVSADLTYIGMRFCNGCTATTFPSSVLGNFHYGYVDFNYYTRQTALSEPTVAPTAVCPEDAACDGDCSVALCGDGFVNAAANEQCDDSNVIDGDGCSSTCTTENGGSTGSGTDGTDGTGLGTDGTTDSGPSGSESGDGPTTGSTPTTDSNGSSDGQGDSGDPFDSDGTGSSASASGGESGGVPFTPGQSLGETGCSVGSRNLGSTAWMLLFLAGLSRRRTTRRR